MIRTRILGRLVLLGLLLLLLLGVTLTQETAFSSVATVTFPAKTGCSSPPYKPGYAPCDKPGAWYGELAPTAVPAPTPRH